MERVCNQMNFAESARTIYPFNGKLKLSYIWFPSPSLLLHFLLTLSFTRIYFVLQKEWILSCFSFIKKITPSSILILEFLLREEVK